MDTKIAKKFSRLKSLGLPRDLTLGGTKPKKVYIPNVSHMAKSKHVTKKQEKYPKGNSFPKRKKRGSHRNPKFVRSSGIFSESQQRCRQSAGDHNQCPEISLPVFEKTSWNLDKKPEDDNIINYHENESSDEEKVTLQPILWSKPSHVKINKRKTSYFNQSMKTFNGKTDQTEFGKSFFDRNLYNANNPSLLLFKLPDLLPSKGLGNHQTTKTKFEYSLSMMLEGHVGTLQIRKSGGMAMKIGNCTYSIDSTSFSCESEDISVISNKEKPIISSLGAVQHRFIINPDWIKLFNSAS